MARRSHVSIDVGINHMPTGDIGVLEGIKAVLFVLASWCPGEVGWLVLWGGSE